MAAVLVEISEFNRGVMAGSDWRRSVAPAELLTEFEKFADLLQQLPRWTWPGLLEGHLAVSSGCFIDKQTASYALGFCRGASRP